MLPVLDADQLDRLQRQMKFAQHGSRGVALALAAKLDAALSDLITARCKADIDEIETLFSERGLLGSLTNKLQYLFLTGVISPHCYEQATIIARIRNRFAHDGDVETFEHDRIRGQMGNLDLLDRPFEVDDGRHGFYRDLASGLGLNLDSLGDQYVAIISILIAVSKAGATQEGLAIIPIL